MKLKFKQQQYQDDAVMSIVDCFKGQQKSTRKEIGNRMGILEEIYFSNAKIDLTESELKTNIREVQRRNDITLTNPDIVGYNDFTIEMETGTGKTYTYIKTMYELNEHYGWSKFIVMVPSIAIREGVQKSFQITSDHFQELYHKKIRFFTYNSSNSSNIANINDFASNNDIQVMIINFQAFSAKGAANRRIYEELDELQSRRPIDVIKAVRPILIIDEPQKFGEQTESLFKEFNPLFTIRYSATHKKNKEYNKIYRLDAIDAYNDKLVKKINVKGIEVLNNKSESAYLFLDKVDISSKHDPEAIMEIDVKTNNGFTRKLVRLKTRDDLYVKSNGLTAYKGYVVSEIDGRYDNYDKVFFTNGVEISVGQAFGDINKDDIIRIQIRETIRTHLEKEKELHKLGIKVLSLFFIDEVAKYKYYENSIPQKGDYAKIFEQEYVKALADYRNIIDDEYRNYLDSFETGKIHTGYFSIDKKKKDSDGESILIDNEKAIKKSSNGDYISFDKDAYDLIMKDKERLLSLDEPVRFVFSHSALREGWDNPNIFQICTLKHSNSEISKRQEIGRGLRICVNKDGERMDYKVLEDNFHTINTLTVIASESYESFASSLQTELSETLTVRPKNFTWESFEGKILTNDLGEKYVFTQEHYQDFLIFNVLNGYVDQNNNYKITDKFIEDMENEKIEVMPALVGFEKEVSNLMKKLYSTNNTKLISDERRENIKRLVPNSNFMKKEFQDLWNKINIKTIYEVDFDTNELIEKAINSINAKLNVNKMKVKITEGSQKEKITYSSITDKKSMEEGSIKTEIIEDFHPSEVEYDLIGEITKDTRLTRKTIIRILSNISPQKFEMYKYNPEEFIKKVCHLINNEKAATVIDGITYHKTEQKYSNDIFTINNVRGELGENAIDVKKHIYDFLKYDSINERNFAEKLENGEVTVYAKLPSGFKIPTPVGNYNPDWAIVFDNSESKFKYVYFIAETKGSMDSMQLREVENAKIECARKHFECLDNEFIKYDVVTSYDELINKVLA